MTKIKTELEQKIELMDSLKNVKNVVNGAGGNITEDTPYLQYGEKVLEVIGGGSSRKGSFDSTTQQLTLNYDYLVEKANSSTTLTDEQKAQLIASLNNSDMVINMASVPETMPENDYVYGFAMSSEGTGIGECYVDKQTPTTLRLAIVESFGVFGSYESLAGFYTQIMGEPMTPEMIEAQYAPLIVDENLCTVSGTLGNFSVEFN